MQPYTVTIGSILSLLWFEIVSCRGDSNQDNALFANKMEDTVPDTEFIILSFSDSKLSILWFTVILFVFCGINVIIYYCCCASKQMKLKHKESIPSTSLDRIVAQV
eukprot:994752_1